MKKLVNLIKNFLSKGSPQVPVQTFKMEQFDKTKKSLLEQTAKTSCCEGGKCACSTKEPVKKTAPKTTATSKPVAKKSTKPKGK